MRRFITPAAALAFVLTLCPSGWAASPTEQIRGFFASAVLILEDPATEDKPDERFRAIQAIAREIFDFHEAARLSLGPDWDARTPSERDEFVRAFADLLERAFIGGVAARIWLADGVKVSYLDESIEGGTATVRTIMVSRSGLELALDYRMIELPDRWAVRDVVIDGMSLVANYRAQFARIIQASSYRDLVRQIQAKVSGGPTETLRKELAETPVRKVSTATPFEGVTTAARSAEPLEPLAVPITPAKIEPALSREPSAPPPPPVVTTFHPPVAVRAATGSSYWVQVGAFKNPEAAMRLASLLREEKRPGSRRRAVTVATGPADAPLTRVRVGPFSDRAEAAAKLRELQARGYRPFIAEAHD
jgi:phospholipid transport system substrate-binding protein